MVLVAATILRVMHQVGLHCLSKQCDVGMLLSSIASLVQTQKEDVSLDRKVVAYAALSKCEHHHELLFWLQVQAVCCSQLPTALRGQLPTALSLQLPPALRRQLYACTALRPGAVGIPI